MKNATTSPAARRGPAASLGLLVFRLHLGARTVAVASAIMLAVVLVAGPASVHCLADGLHSDLTIQPGKQLLLGGSQEGAFKVAVKNMGTVVVEIKEQLSNGAISSKGISKPGQGGVLRFGAGSAAGLLNPGLSNARLDLKVTGDTGNRRMATEPLRTTGSIPSTPRLTGGDLSAVLAAWKGTLAYLDYGTQQTVTLNTAMRGVMTRPDQLVLQFDYEESSKRHVFGTDTLSFAADGTRVRWDNTDFVLLSKQWLPGQTLQFVLEGQGRDDNRAATLRKTVTLGPQQFVVKKEVRYALGTAFLQRNQYVLGR